MYLQSRTEDFALKTQTLPQINQAKRKSPTAPLKIVSSVSEQPKTRSHIKVYCHKIIFMDRGHSHTK